MLNKKITSEVAIGTIVIIATVLGGLFWLQNNNQYASSAAVRDKAQVDAKSRIVFLGDSITAIEDWNTLFGVSYISNAGISGNTTDDVIARLSAAIKYKPQKLFLMIGINDLFKGKDVDYISKNYEIILNGIKAESPTTTIYLQSVLPVNNDISKIAQVDSEKIVALNDKLKSLADEKKIFFIDLYPSFCGADRKLYKRYAPDGVHPNFFGYAAWKKIIAPYVK